jgi:ferredoxin
MPRRFLLSLLVVLVFSAPLFAQDTLPAELTLRDVAHTRGVKGGDLAEALGQPRAIDKGMKLVELGVSPEQLRLALEKLGAQTSATASNPTEPGFFTPRNTIREIAVALDFNGKTLAHDFGLDVGADKDAPVGDLGVTQEKIDTAIAHNLADEENVWSLLKYPLSTIVVLFAVGWMLKWGVGKNPKRRKDYYPEKVYLGVLLGAVIVLGFLLGKSPNPMEGAVKVFKSTVGLYDAVLPKLLAMGFFLVLAVVGNKVICGWACPFGALEELLYSLPWFKKIKRRNFPFWISNTIRTLLFVLFILGLYGWIAPKGYVFYHYLNPFNLFNFDFGTRMVPIAVAIYLAISLFFYRPFCRFICPFGFLSWFVERISLTRVRIDFDRCIDCKACTKACPLGAAEGRLAKKTMPEDCFSCMRCLRVCPTDAIHFRPAWGPPSPPEIEPPATPEP